MLTLSKRYLELEQVAYRGTGGVSAKNRHLGFVPAFLDSRTRKIYSCSFGDGKPAPFHILDGLPDERVVARDRYGRPSQVLGTLIAGFTLNGRFCTREEAAALVVARESHLLGGVHRSDDLRQREVA